MSGEDLQILPFILPPALTQPPGGSSARSHYFAACARMSPEACPASVCARTNVNDRRAAWLNQSR